MPFFYRYEVFCTLAETYQPFIDLSLNSIPHTLFYLCKSTIAVICYINAIVKIKLSEAAQQLLR